MDAVRENMAVAEETEEDAEDRRGNSLTSDGRRRNSNKKTQLTLDYFV